MPELAAKPVPFMVTIVPVGPVVGLSDIDGVTVYCAEAEFDTASLALTVRDPAVDAGTVNVAEKLPVELVVMVPVVVTDVLS